ncbi:dihydropteroate synthase [Arsenicitalea aurantiaca]|uniref:Dihydropteroate synthase n=2 Tax=Arsenicitalea aurantiaca TaxID=1783274 RepID=A0A433XGJ8_9HYPH|nr:dihydropteroate synthase [Arsenicitalea aurantiaca]RUT33213.1 dihydropteroate synthase [Arsenicitalea aurantiaca]
MVHGAHRLDLPGGDHLELGRRALVMGILNVTPDSFSDGGSHDDAARAVAHARLLIGEGADLIDVGGESTRPGAEPVGVQAELDRVMPVLDALAADGIAAPVSIDTYKALVADQAVQAGARIINDVRGLQREPEIADVAALHGVPVIIMHWDEARDRDRDLVSEMIRFLEQSLQIAERAGLSRQRVIIDPGFGFAKTLDENYALLRRLGELHVLGCPLLVGTSRKSMIGRLLDKTAGERLPGTIATSVLAYCAGAHIFRVHDVGANRDALRVSEATLYGPPAGS